MFCILRSGFLMEIGLFLHIFLGIGDRVSNLWFVNEKVFELGEYFGEYKEGLC